MNETELKAYYNPEGSPLRGLQMQLLEILKDFDAFCRENGLSYSLAFGTLLGAVRHKGYIPWDDDLDVMMTREQWNELEKLIGKKGRLTEKMHIKRRLKPEICIKGVGIVDLFIVDFCPPKGIKRWIKQAAIQLVQMLYRCRWYYQAWRNGGKPHIKPWLVLLPISFLHSPKGWQQIWDKVLTWFTKDIDGFSEEMCCYTAAVRDIPKIYPASVFKGTIELPFEGLMFPCIQSYDEFLTIRYGNYMKLPDKIHNHGRV